MGMYTSTRKKMKAVDATWAILQGISEEGGLFVPNVIPTMDFELEELKTFTYTQLAYRVMRLFFPDIKEEDLKYCIEQAYDDKFDTKRIAPVVSTKNANFLELFHGPTLAFKDMALSILPYLMLMSKKYQKEEKETVILTATSGDTGKAALEGFADVEGTKIIVFFPEDGVSEIQKRQMLTQRGENTLVVGIKGNFDDAQTGVKEIFADKAFEKELEDNGYQFSSANSINIGRLVPQIVYYFYAYGQMLNKKEVRVGDCINVAVPTGNFGNILAGFYAKKMGLPIKKLICASNENKVLFDFFENGTYDRNRPFYLTTSPSMDILISSNLERLLYHISGENSEAVDAMMQDLKQTGKYNITPEMKENLKDFYGGYASDDVTKAMIKKVYEQEGYLMDTHTAVAYAAYEAYREQEEDMTPTVIVSTASPYKFTKSVMTSIDEKYQSMNDFTLLDEMEKLCKEKMPEAIRNIESRPVLHDKICNVDEMEKTVREFL